MIEGYIHKVKTILNTQTDYQDEIYILSFAYSVNRSKYQNTFTFLGYNKQVPNNRI